MKPKVSFVVPCYRFAHFLPECVNSILMQTYENFEVLVMDDCSPDNTPEVARSFRDPRVKHIRNEHNLGHLRNYNKGIELAQGEYIWLISADDSLRRRYALESYIDVLDKYSNVGYVFSAGVGLKDQKETGILGNYYYGDRDRIFGGRDFISRVLKTGGILSPSVMARKSCYQNISYFPLDMPHQGDMYIWFMWALQCDVAYFADAMVHYRLHQENMTKAMNTTAPLQIMHDELGVLWKTKHAAARRGFRTLDKQIAASLARRFAYAVIARTYGDIPFPYKLTVQDCEEVLVRSAADAREARQVRAAFFTQLADEHCWRANLASTREYYSLAIRNQFMAPKVWIALSLARMGNAGFALRKLQASIRQRVKRLSKPSNVQTVPTGA